jgi:ATP phosphoribosyltransferase-like protein
VTLRAEVALGSLAAWGELLVADAGREILVWDVAAKALIARQATGASCRDGQPHMAIAVDGTEVAVPDGIRELALWDLDRLVLLLKGGFAARDKVGLKMNLPEAKLAELLAALPALRTPTIAQLAQGGWVAVETIIDERVVREIIPQLKALGAEGIIEYPLNKVVY